MIYYYQTQFWKYHKKKLFFPLQNSVTSSIHLTNQQNPYKNFQKINFNKKDPFTIKNQFTFDWHIRPTKCLKNVSKNQKLLKLASFYSQLTNNNFSNKFTYLMIFHLNIEINELKKRKKNISRFYPYNKSHIHFFSDIEKLANWKEIELDKNQKLFTNLQSKNQIWFAKTCLPFSNRTFWWLLLPTQSLLTHIHSKLFLQRIKNFLQNIQKLTLLNKKNNLIKWNSTVLFNLFPEFLIEKPINWYWMLPFFGCIGLMNSNLTYINFTFLQNYSIPSNSENQVNLNKFEMFSKNKVEKEISYEMFRFFDYKKYLFDSSLKYINNFFINRNHFVITLKKTWFSKQKDHYICNYKNFVIMTNFKKDIKKLTKLAIIYWWKQNWHEITHRKFVLTNDLIPFNVVDLPNFKDYLTNTLFFSKNENYKVYCLETLFYSKFYWYWHNLDTKYIKNFFNNSKTHPKIQQIDGFFLTEKTTIDNFVFKIDALLSLVTSLFDKKLINKDRFSINLIDYLSNNSFSNKKFPFKIKFPWMVYYLKNSKLKKRLNTKIPTNSDSIKEILIDNFENLGINKNSQKIKKSNLLFQKILYSKIKKNKDYKQHGQLFLPLFLNNNNILSRSPLLFCVSSKNQSKIKSNDFLKKDFKLTKIEDNYTNFLLKKNKKVIFDLTLYNSIGCEILESDFHLYKINNTKAIYNNQNQLNAKKNQSISSFHRASFLFENIFSTLFFKLGTTIENSINYYSNNLNIKKIENNTFLDCNCVTSFSLLTKTLKNIKIKKNPILMLNFNSPKINGSLKNQNEIFRELANRIPFNQEQIYLSKCFPNSFYNKKESDFFQKQYTNREGNYNKVLNVKRVAYLSSHSKKQKLSTVKKRYTQLDLTSKNLGHFFVYNLLKSSQNLLSQFVQFEKEGRKITTIKKINYKDNKIVFDKKNNPKYKLFKPTSLLDLQSKIRKVKQNKIQFNFLNKEKNGTLVLLNYFDFRKKKRKLFYK